MILNAIAAALLILNSVSLSPMTATKQEAAQSRLQTNPTNEQYESAMILGRVRAVLRATGYTGILAYSGGCQVVNGLPFVALPKIAVHQTESNVALQAMHQVFRGNTNVTVAEGRNKIILITIGDPLTAILKTRIPVLQLAPLAQYNPALAIGAVEATREVEEATARLKLHTPPIVFQMLLEKPSNGLPHLPHINKNVSVEQVLSLIATTFNGMIVFGTCARSNGEGLLEIYFMGLD